MFNKIIQDIKEVKIQGAENIAKASVKAIEDILNKPYTDLKHHFKELLSSRDELLKTRSTEPCLKNTLTLLFYNLTESNFKTELPKNILKANNHFLNSDKIIFELGARKIMAGMNVFTHCHSNTVINILKEAKKNGVNFSVKNTETRPLFQGRKTALELSEIKIPVEHFIDSAGRIAIKKSDIMLIGADAITTEGKIINKIGSELFAETAKKRNIPVYVCTNSWKFDVNTVFGYDINIEKRYEKEVWADKPKGVVVSNHAFEEIDPELISGVISEIGVFNPNSFVLEIKRIYPWLFKR